MIEEPLIESPAKRSKKYWMDKAIRDMFGASALEQIIEARNHGQLPMVSEYNYEAFRKSAEIPVTIAILKMKGLYVEPTPIEGEPDGLVPQED